MPSARKLRRNERADAIQAARRLLRLPASATRLQIKDAYRELARQWHPDTIGAEAGDDNRMQELNRAYALLIAYCDSYAFSFAPDVVEQQCRRQDPIEYWKDQFLDEG